MAPKRKETQAPEAKKKPKPAEDIPFGDVEEEPFCDVGSEHEQEQEKDEEQASHLPPGPACPAQCFQWPECFFTTMCHLLGPPAVFDAVKDVHWDVHTCFSGMGCPEVALQMLEAGLRRVGPDFHSIKLDISMGKAADLNKDCRKVLCTNYVGRCVFGDVRGFVKSGKTLNSMTLQSECYCYTHSKDCPLDVSEVTKTGRVNVMVAGPPCTPWSKRGKRQGNKDPQAHTHLIWAKYVLEQKFDIVVFECVYDDEVLRNVVKVFGKEYDIQDAKLSAHSLGYCVSRVRLYVIMVRKAGRCSWTSKMSLDGMMKALLRRVVMKASDTFMLTSAELTELASQNHKSKVTDDDFTKSEMKHKAAYEVKCPDKVVWDLSQNPSFSANTELKSGALPNLTTNCGSLYSTQLRRTMHPFELLLNQGIPATEQAAKASHTPRIHFPVSSQAIIKMAGNGMHVPCVGAVLLCAMLCVKTSE